MSVEPADCPGPAPTSASEYRDLAGGLWESAAATATAVEPGSMSECVYWEHAHRHRLSFRYADSWATSAQEVTIDGADELLRTHVGGRRTALMVINDVLVHASVARGRATVSLACNDQARCAEVLDRLRDALPKPDTPPGAPRAWFSFSWKTDHGVSWLSRALDVTPWAEIAENYAAHTRRQLERLTDFRPSDSGTTMIWHGEPGTGKTHALRALAYDWRDWCDLHVVTDPDQLFGANAGYLMELIAHDTTHEGRHRLVVLEDSGELLAGDARRQVGHGLSRFLNLCDGLLGQAQRLSLLITTNEPIKRLHPAVRRPGRCAAEVEFQRLDVKEANRWLDGRTENRTSRPLTIAQLYALASGHVAADRPPTQAIGFAAALPGSGDEQA